MRRYRSDDVLAYSHSLFIDEVAGIAERADAAGHPLAVMICEANAPSVRAFVTLEHTLVLSVLWFARHDSYGSAIGY
jgi:hypothetical protein